MIDRRQCMALIALSATSAGADEGVPAQVPPLSSAPLGDAEIPPAALCYVWGHAPDET